MDRNRPSAYDLLNLPPNLGAVEVLEDPAMQTNTASNPTKWRDLDYTKSDDCHLGLSNQTAGPFNAIEGDPVPAAAHSEVSLTQFVSYPTIQANSPMKVELLNVSGADKTNVAIDVRGTRLRE